LRLTRRRWIDLFAGYDARIEIIYVEPPLPAILGQNARRDRPVPVGVIRGLAEKCEPPTLAEAHGVMSVGEGANRTGLRRPGEGGERS
jgi:predicted kinase